MSEVTEVTDGFADDAQAPPDDTQAPVVDETAVDETAAETIPETPGPNEIEIDSPEAQVAEDAAADESDAAEEELDVPDPEDDRNIVEAAPLSEHDAAVKNYHGCAGGNAARKQDRKYPSAEAE